LTGIQILRQPGVGAVSGTGTGGKADPFQNRSSRQHDLHTAQGLDHRTDDRFAAIRAARLVISTEKGSAVLSEKGNTRAG
jgi:hypothetical protein